MMRRRAFLTMGAAAGVAAMPGIATASILSASPCRVDHEASEATRRRRAGKAVANFMIEKEAPARQDEIGGRLMQRISGERYSCPARLFRAESRVAVLPPILKIMPHISDSDGR